MIQNRIKVLQLLEAAEGGTRWHLILLASGLDKQHFSVEVAAPAVRKNTIDQRSFEDQVTALGIPFHRVDMVREISPFSDLKSLIKLVKLMRKQQYDLVHAHSSKAGILGRIAAKLTNTPAIYTPNGFYFLGATSSIKTWLFLWIERFAGLITNRLVAVADSEYETAVKRRVIREDKLITIPNAIDVASLNADIDARDRLRKKLDISPDTLVVGTVSRHISQKDPLTLVRAAHLVLQEYPETQFIWCGDGELRQETEALAMQLGIHHQFHFLGFCRQHLDMVNTFDVFLLSSIFEGLPYALLDVMALAIPVVATDVVGTRDIIINGETGLLVESENPEALSQAIIELLQDSDKRYAMGLSGRSLVAEKYDLSIMIQNMEKLYQTVSRINK